MDLLFVFTRLRLAAFEHGAHGSFPKKKQLYVEVV